MKQEFEGLLEQSSCYRETYTEIQTRDEHGCRVEYNIHNILEEFHGKNVRITIETLDEEDEDAVTVTYRELFKRCNNNQLNLLGVSPWYINEGGDPTAIRDISKPLALLFMPEDEFDNRCHSNTGA